MSVIEIGSGADDFVRQRGCITALLAAREYVGETNFAEFIACGISAFGDSIGVHQDASSGRQRNRCFRIFEMLENTENRTAAPKPLRQILRACTSQDRRVMTGIAVGQTFSSAVQNGIEKRNEAA